MKHAMTKNILEPDSEEELIDAIATAFDAKTPLGLLSGGSRQAIGRQVDHDTLLSMSKFTGIIDYQPTELVLIAGAATPLSLITAALDEKGQMLAFEPPNYAGLSGADPEATTLAGTMMTGFSGPRRPQAGAARDHILAVEGVTGRGEKFKSGAAVVKNVTGYDLPKLMVGSYGTLAAMMRLTVKVLPRAEAQSTLVFEVKDSHTPDHISQAFRLSTMQALSGAVLIKAGINGKSSDILAFRIEAAKAALKSRQDKLLKDMSDLGFEQTEIYKGKASRSFWEQVRDGHLLATKGSVPPAIVRILLPLSQLPGLCAKLADLGLADYLVDWGGSMLLVRLPSPPAKNPEEPEALQLLTMLQTTAQNLGGDAMLLTGPEYLRRSDYVNPPLSPPLLALTKRVKQALDPANILNPGRLYPDI